MGEYVEVNGKQVMLSLAYEASVIDIKMIRLVNRYDNVYTDIAGDIFCYRLIESLTDSIPAGKILFGSDFPWLGPRANLARVVLTNIDDSVKRKIFRENAMRVYGIDPDKG